MLLRLESSFGISRRETDDGGQENRYGFPSDWMCRLCHTNNFLPWNTCFARKDSSSIQSRMSPWPPALEYMSVHIWGTFMHERLTGYGKDRWELVSARWSEGDYEKWGYECIFNRIK